MGYSLTRKIIEHHMLSGKWEIGKEIGIRVHQTLTQDSTGTMAYLQLEALGIDRIRTECSVAYIDHNTLQCGYQNADDHEFIRSVAAKYGIVFSKPGNGICHQLHLERFVVPGKVLIGSDSHTPTAGGAGMLSIGAGGLDVAVAMARGVFYLNVPSVRLIHLTGRLSNGVSAKDIVLEVLRRLTVRGGVGYILEYGGPGIRELTVPERATIANMGAETGATTSIFPSDHQTLAFLESQGRSEAFFPIEADSEAGYQDRLEIDLDRLEPMTAAPHSPDNVVSVSRAGTIPVSQVIIGSCTNSSYADLMKAAAILKDRHVHPAVSLCVAPGSSSILQRLAHNGALADLITSGARILESACGPCIGMGQAPCSGGISLRTTNRNFKGRCGTPDAQVYLVSPETAAVSSITGCLTDPRQWGQIPDIDSPRQAIRTDGFFIFPDPAILPGPVRMGPNIKPVPVGQPIPDTLSGEILLKTGDHVTTDDIMPSDASLLPFRSNIPELAKSCFRALCPDFSQRAKRSGGGFIIGGWNYGQGSSREHAALVPLYLGIRGVITLSLARIHRANLINAGILPLEFVNPEDYERVQAGDHLTVTGLSTGLAQGQVMAVPDSGHPFPLAFHGSPREIDILKAGGYLLYSNHLKEVLPS